MNVPRFPRGFPGFPLQPIYDLRLAQDRNGLAIKALPTLRHDRKYAYGWSGAIFSVKSSSSCGALDAPAWP